MESIVCSITYYTMTFLFYDFRPVDMTVSPPSYINTAAVHEVLPGPTATWPDFAVGCTRLQSFVDASEYGDVCKDILTDLARKGFFSSGEEDNCTLTLIYISFCADFVTFCVFEKRKLLSLMSLYYT